MFLKKNYFKYAVALVLFLMSTSLLSSCDGVLTNYKSINTVEELYAMNKNGSYRLNADLDLQNNFWIPKKIKSFDGNGHTIKNCMINEMVQNDEAFFYGASKIQNVRFENITVTLTSAEDVAIVTTSASLIDNVQVVNSIIVGSTNVKNVNIGVLASADTYLDSISNCTVDGCNIKCDINSNGRVVIGGINGANTLFGKGTHYYDNTVKNCNFEINSSSKYANLFVGGMLGLNDRSKMGELLERCISKDNIFNIDASGEDKSFTRVGGIIGSNSYLGDSIHETGGISQCGSIGNEFDIDAKNSNVGGIAGRSDGQIVDCLGDNNSFNVSGQNKITSNVGGICGISNQTIRSSIVQNSRIIGCYDTGDNILTGGLVGLSKASVAYCLVNNTSVYGTNSDIFSNECNTIFNSYVYKVSVSENVNSIPMLDDFSKIMDVLSLDENVWEIAEDETIILKTFVRDEL